MPHRYEDEHACKPVKKSDQYEKIKKNVKFFNWSNDAKSKKKESNGEPELSFGDKVLRFLVCCGTQPKKDKNDKSKTANRRPPEPSSNSSQGSRKLQKFNALKCPLCSETFED